MRSWMYEEKYKKWTWTQSLYQIKFLRFSPTLEWHKDSSDIRCQITEKQICIVKIVFIN